MQTTGKSRTAVEGRSRESLPKKSRQAMGETLAVAQKKLFPHGAKDMVGKVCVTGKGGQGTMPQIDI